ncbi:MAG: PEP-CTERM sorting domain-containing protein [Pseudomonadota bacterium]
MKKALKSVLWFMFSILLIPAVSSAASLVVEDGELVGARGVIVNGAYYDVSFIDGSPEAIYTDELGNYVFTFSSDEEAIYASQALLDQVFLDVYDKEPKLTLGIESEVFGYAATTYAVDSNYIYSRYAINMSAESVSDDSVLFGPPQRMFHWVDSTNTDVTVYAKWSVAAVPVPGTLILFSSGLLGIVIAARKKIRKV